MAYSNRKRAFFFHYNKPASLSKGKVVISLHYKGTCHLVDNIECYCPVKGRVRSTSPKFVMVGSASHIDIKDGIAIII